MQEVRDALMPVFILLGVPLAGLFGIFMLLGASSQSLIETLILPTTAGWCWILTPAFNDLEETMC